MSLDAARPNEKAGRLRVTCPLSTDQIADLVLRFVDLYNEPAGIELYTYQRVFMLRIIESVLERDGSVITGLWSRQSGKSESISSLAGAMCIFLPALAKTFPDDPRLMQYREGFWIGIFAPRLQQSGIIYERIRRRAERESSAEIYADPDIDVALTQSRGDQVSWSNGSFVISQTASEQTNVEGKTYHLVIIDEAQLISRSKVTKEIMPMLAATNGSCVKIGTASFFRGGFHDSITYNLEVEEEGGKRNHFEFPYDVVIAQKRQKFEETQNAFHLNYEAWVNAELQRLGGNTDNEEFRMNFRLLWQESAAGAISFDIIQDSAEPRIEIGQVRLNRRQTAGLDFGRIRDSSSLSILEEGDEIEYNLKPLLRPGDEPPVYREHTFVGMLQPEGPWKVQLDKIVAYLSNFAVDTLCVDGTGVGDPLAEQLHDMLPGIQVVSIRFSILSKDYLYRRYTDEWEAGRIRYAAGEQTQDTWEYKQFIHQHAVLEKHYNGAYMTCFAPEGDHDDWPDSGALALYASTLPRPDSAEVECSTNPFYGRGAASFRDRHTDTFGSRSDRYRRR